MAEPSPLTWTLRFKSHRTTILLHTEPLSTFLSIKSDLLTALQETGIKSTSGEALALPESADEIQFGCPIDIHDASQGFKLGEWHVTEADDEDDVEEGGKGKGKAKAATGKKTNGSTKASDSTKNCPKGAGLKDGAVLAFRWVGDGVWDGETGSGEGKMWGVKLASFEDAYGVENEGDVGGVREFEG